MARDREKIVVRARRSSYTHVRSYRNSRIDSLANSQYTVWPIFNHQFGLFSITNLDISHTNYAPILPLALIVHEFLRRGGARPRKSPSDVG